MGEKLGNNEILRTKFLCIFKLNIIDANEAGQHLASKAGSHFYFIAGMCLQ